MKLFIRKLLTFFALLLLVLCIITYILIRIDNSVLQQLYQHQLTKIKQKDSVTTLFIGDSSLGSTIDSDEFSRLSSNPTLNCALTGIYGYEGSYNILKTAYTYHPEIENVVIMQAIDMQTRPVSFAGYVRTTRSLHDFIELTNRQKLGFLEASYYYIKSIEIDRTEDNAGRIQNDFVIQNEQKEFIPVIKPFEVADINPDKNTFLRKIVDFCSRHELNLIYVHGPIYDELAHISTAYINAVNERIPKSGIFLFPDIVTIRKNDLGDSEDHIKPKLKKEYSLTYYELIKTKLR